MSGMFRSRLRADGGRRPLWRTLLPLVLLALLSLVSWWGPFRAVAQSASATPPSAPTSTRTAADATSGPVAPDVPAPTATAPDKAATPQATSPAPGAAPVSKPANAPEAAGADPQDTNVDAQEGPRRATAPTLSTDEAPEYRESADNNISFPVDI